MWLGCCIGGCGLCSVEEFQGELVPKFNYFKTFQVFEFLNPVGSRQTRQIIFKNPLLLFPSESQQEIESE
jgi:hypothetical protein